MVIKKLAPLLLIIVSLFLISGCKYQTEVTDDALSLLETEVYYRQKVRLPEGAKLEVRLEDVSKMDLPSVLISSSRREIKNTPPFALQITFRSDQIQVDHRYNLQASIKVDGKLLFISTTNIDPFAIGNNSPIKIKVDKVGG